MKHPNLSISHVFSDFENIGRGTNNIDLSLNKPDGSTYTIKTIHTFSKNQISWFKAGSALNLIADQLN